MSFVSVERFKSLARRREVPRGTAIRKGLKGLSTALDGRRVLFTASTARVDRENDLIRQDGWRLDAFRANPVCLWSHRSDEPPIGRWAEVGLKNGVLRAVVEYVPADMPVVGPLAEMCLRMNRTGFLNAVSVGFIPMKWEVANERDDGETWCPPLDYIEQELIEISLCSIPANPDALIDPGDRQGADAAPRAASAPGHNVFAEAARRRAMLLRLYRL